MRVGALPAFPTNSLKYNLTWSVDGLINEYCHPCEAIRDGEIIEVLPLEGLEHFSWTAPSTRPSTPRAAWARCATTLGPRADAGLQDRALPRPPRADEDAAAGPAAASLTRKPEGHPAQEPFRCTMQDVVLVFVTVSGLNAMASCAGGVCPQDLCRPRRDRPLSAIQITTAAGICAAVDLFREGKLPQRWLHPPGTGGAARLPGQPLRQRVPAVAPGGVHRLIY
jgi:hypothetical protein